MSHDFVGWEFGQGSAEWFFSIWVYVGLFRVGGASLEGPRWLHSHGGGAWSASAAMQHRSRSGIQCVGRSSNCTCSQEHWVYLSVCVTPRDLCGSWVCKLLEANFQSQSKNVWAFSFPNLPPTPLSPSFDIKIILILLKANISPCLFHGTLINSKTVYGKKKKKKKRAPTHSISSLRSQGSWTS